MKKAFDQTVRDLKRGVNKKVLKVPSIEQKVLDATSNEPWGPHGSVLADIAQATRNYHEYQMIMAVIWKRINDTGKNWRHVYKALTVLDYLVAHGSERVIDDIREHAYQISTLSDFQYIDSSGRDQGNNVRKKSQSLVILVNDKERLQEVRQKAAANRDKYRNTTMGRPGSGSYGDRYEDDRYEGRYGNRDDDRNGYGRERDWGSRDSDRGRYGDSYGREGDRYGRNYEDRSSRDGYRDDDYRGRTQSVDDYHYGSRSRSSEGDRYRANEDDGQYSSRGSGARADENSQDGSSMGNRRHSEQSLGAPPSYEEAVSAGRSPTYSEREGESSVGYAPRVSSPTGASPSHATTAAAATTGPASPPVPVSPPGPTSFQPKTHDNNNQDDDGFDEFDPRGAFSASSNASNVPPAATAGVEMDLLGSLSESFSSNALALVPTQPDTTTEAHAPANSDSGPTFAAGSSSSAINDQQPFDDPFGDGPFQAISSGYTLPVQQEIPQSINSFNDNSSMQSLDAPQNDTTPFGVGPADAQPPTSSHQFVQHELSTGNQDIDILADILPPSSFVNPQTGYNAPPQPMSHGGFPLQTNQPSSQFGLPAQTVQNAPQNMQPETTNPPGFGFPTQHGQPQLQANYPLQTAESVPQTGFTGQTMAFTVPVQAGQASQLGFHAKGGPIQMSQPNSNYYGNVHAQSAPMGPSGTAYNTMAPTSAGQFSQESFLSKPGFVTQMPPQMGAQGQPSNLMSTTVSTTPASTGLLASVSQPPKEKFEMKSSVWADTLSRGLVNLNISGSKTNPLADIGVDFDAINRKEKRMEKPSTTTTPVMSTVTMGKAMGSGTGLGRAGATGLRPPPNAMMGSGNMGMGVGPMGGYGVGQPMGMGMNMMGNMGMGMRPNMGIGQGLHMQQQQGFPPGSNMPGNPNYSQQPYGGGYR